MITRLTQLRILSDIYDKSNTTAVLTAEKYSKTTVDNCESDVLKINTVTRNFSDQTKSHRCIIDVSINNIVFETLVDTGADLCYITKENYETITNSNTRMIPFKTAVLTANKSKLNVIGMEQLHVVISGYVYNVQFQVQEAMTYDVILGWKGFLKLHEGCINAKTETLRQSQVANQKYHISKL